MNIAPTQRPKGSKVMLMATCLCDAFFDEVAMATVEVLEMAGCEVVFPEAQTCCGQPAFNGGDWEASRKVVRHTLEVFSGDLPVVIPSGSCAAMVFHGARLAFEGQPETEAVRALGNRTWEVSDFLVNGLGITEWGGSFPARVALHRACHSRGTGTIEASTTLLQSVGGLELVPYGEPEQCCGFGGTFSVTFPHVSKSMGQLKIEKLREAGPDWVVSPDMSCLMHQKGLAEKAGIPFRCRHVVEILRDARLAVENKVS